MVKEAIGFGNTIDEAKENAIAKLNVSELEDIQIDLIAMPKKKILGLFGGTQAQVRAYIEIPDKKTKNNPKKAKPQKEKTVAADAKPKKEEETKAVEKNVKTDTEVSKYGEPIDASEIDAATPAGKAVAYIKSVLLAVGCDKVEIKVQSCENASLIHLEGENLSVVIGRRGETLDALQYLASLAANNGGSHYKISLNIGDYRERREETLIKLAKRISAQVLKSGKNRSLEPMNPYERRIIHTAVQNIEGVVSTSFGEGNARRVVIALEGAEIHPPRFNDRRRSPSHSRGRRTNNQVQSAPAREPKKDSDIPLYGKIN